MSTNNTTKKVRTVLQPSDEIVISGIAGRFPDSDNVQILKKNLFDKVDLITDDDRRWKLDHPDIPQRTGKINNVGKFDALFFGVHFKQAHTMDPMSRMLLEHAYEAIVDAGINPKQLRDTRTGVFMGACFSESEKTWFYEKLQVNGFGITGCSRAMMANRVSYWLGVTGPSYTLDSACSSSLVALEHAYQAIRDGQCDSAIVGGANLCLHPYVSLQFSRLGVLSSDGHSRAFDADASGYARSESVAVVYVQRAKDAKRIYATLVHAKTNSDGYKEQGITFPSSLMQSNLLRDCYKECDVPVHSLSYVECHGTGTKTGDPEEINAIDRAFCEGRDTPLLIGSVKSNMGHPEPASGLCQVAKVLIAMESGMIPPNLHYNRPREGVKALEEGRVKVVCESTPWQGGYVGINSFGFGGTNCHVLLKSYTKEKINNGAPSDDLPRLVAVSGRTKESVEVFLNDIDNHPMDIEYIRLLHDIHTDDIKGHLYRGYTIVGSKVAEKPGTEIENYTGTTRPIWFVFAGMGSQWAGMGADLMKFPIFAKAVQKCDAVLRPRGVDIINILTNKDKSIFDNILHSFVGIAAVQIGLVDLLTSIGIVPDSIIGHSVGELGCAYADGCFTAEQMILSAYSRGLASIETEVIFGSMAAVGIGYENIKNMCPPDIEIACHNSADSSTISGPAESMKEFVAKLQADKIFAKEVPCSNIPYHSRYIAPAGPKLLAYLSEIIPEPKPRSRKWVSTSVPSSKWSIASAKLSSAEYHTNNLLNPVLFEETARMIPKDAVTIEIAPHGLLQAILRKSLDPGVTNIALTQRGHKVNDEFLLQAIGRLYNNGLQPNIANLYPPIEFPVSRGTPMIAPSVRWEHSDDWFVTSYKSKKKVASGERNVVLTLQDEATEYMAGYIIDGKNLVPGTGYLALVWETMGKLRAEVYTEVSIVFEDLNFLRPTHIPKEGEIHLTVMIQKATGNFEVSEGGIAVVSGLIRVTPNPAQDKIPVNILPQDDNEEEVMNTKDIYKELNLRGYQYSGAFRGLKSASISMRKGHISWTDNWATFLDNMLQLQMLEMDTRSLYVLTRIRKIVIDTKLHQQEIESMDMNDRQFPIRLYKKWHAVISGGVEIRDAVFTATPRRLPSGDPILEEYKFVAHRDGAQVSLQEAIRLSTHIALECHQIIHTKIIEVIDSSDNVTIGELASPILIEVLDDLPLIQANVMLAAPPDRFDGNALPPNVTFAELKNLSNDENVLLVTGFGLLTRSKSNQLQQILSILRHGGFLLTIEKSSKPDNLSLLSKYNLDIILEKSTTRGNVILLKKKQQLARKTEIIYVNNKEFSWLEKLNSIMNVGNRTQDDVRIVLVGEGNFECGLLGFVNCIRKEPGGEIIRSVLIQDNKAPKFSLQNPLYAKQLQLDLPHNVLRPGMVWGTYRHQLLRSSIKSKLVQHAFVNQAVWGNLSSLCWIEGPIHSDSSQKDLVHVVYSPVNVRDIMLTTGKIVLETPLSYSRFDEYAIGLEYAGIDNAGHRVMGLCKDRGMSNIVVPDRDLRWYVPRHWSLEDAATVPCVYAICYYSLYLNADMKKGDRVLIHSGTEALGQAAIHLALHEGCEVYTTAETDEKRAFIRKMFLSIPDDHILSSNDTNFEQIILKQTNGIGIDIVLNSLTGEKLQASIRCLAKGGRFLKVGKYDIAETNLLGMMIFMREVKFQGIILDNIFAASVNEKMHLNGLLAAGLKNGAIKPLVRKVFEKDDVEAAFRYMTTGKHIGKVILKICKENEAGKVPVLAEPRYYCANDKSYVILGGLGGFGLELADWLVLRGAKNLILIARTGIENGYQRMRIDLWKSYGVNVLIITGVDASNRKDCEYILTFAQKQGPVDAIFNLAVVLKDGICMNQTPQSFEESFKSKARSTKMLDELSRKLCPQLRQFVVFSSMACGRGHAGQTNYGMANSVMERICERRVADGLPGLAIQWGAIGDVGLVAEQEDRELVIGGTSQQQVSSCLEKLENFLLQDSPVVASMVVARKRMAVYSAINIIDAVANIIGLKDPETVAQYTSLPELGMDSLMAVEIKQTLEREFDVFLTAQDIRNLNFAKLTERHNKHLERELMKTKINVEVAEIPSMQLLIRTMGDMTPEVCMQLPTKRDPRKIEVFLLPGMEGCGQVFNPLAPKIRPVTTCLQHGTHNIGLTHTSIPELADYLLPYIASKAEEQRSFVLIGYSFGSLIAIELARRLERRGLSGRLVLIDGAPEQMKAVIEHYFPSTTKEELQNDILFAITDTLKLTANEQLLLNLSKCTSWEQKLDTLLSNVTLENALLSIEDLKVLCTTIYKRIVALQEYDISSLPKIRTPIMLLKPTLQSVHMTEENYGLHKITRDKVTVYSIEGNHITILESDKIVAAINGEPLEDAKEFKTMIADDRPIESDESYTRS